MVRTRWPLAPLRRAIKARLDTDIGAGKFFSYVPQGQEPPYVAMAEVDVDAQQGTKTERAFKVSMVINVWTRETEWNTLDALSGSVVESISKAALVLEDDYTMTRWKFLGGTLGIEPDDTGPRQRAALRFEFWIDDEIYRTG